MKNKLLTIGEFSKRTGCSIKELYIYDSIGLLKPYMLILIVIIDTITLNKQEWLS